jgi:Transposase IS116/IS110/IS902 family
VLRLLAKRNNELGRARNRTACRLHALLAELVPGGIPNDINAASAQRLLDGVKPENPVEVARHALALEHLDDLRRLDTQMRVSKARIAEAIAASGTSLTELFGVGLVVAAMLIGYTGDVARFGNRDHFAAYTGAAPIEVSSGGRITHRLSRRGNRQLNHALHIAAITQIRYPHSPGRAFFDRKVAEGKTKKKAVRALKRRIADAAYRQLLIDARIAKGREGNRGRLCNPAWPAQHPDGRLFGSATPGSAPTPELAAPPDDADGLADPNTEHDGPLTTKRNSIWRAWRLWSADVLCTRSVRGGQARIGSSGAVRCSAKSGAPEPNARTADSRRLNHRSPGHPKAPGGSATELGPLPDQVPVPVSAATCSPVAGSVTTVRLVVLTPVVWGVNAMNIVQSSPGGSTLPGEGSEQLFSPVSWKSSPPTGTVPGAPVFAAPTPVTVSVTSVVQLLVTLQALVAAY